jgi:hypothetical protein
MPNKFPHNIYLAAALVLFAGACAMTIGIAYGEQTVMTKILEAFLQAFSVGVVALVGYAVHSKREED